MSYYPIFLDMDNRRCVVIGGGAVAERKVLGLLQAKAVVTVISPAVTKGLESLLTQGAIRHVARKYEAGDLDDHDIAFVATDDSEINNAVFREARSRSVWVNCADDPEHCDFILPSVLRRGDLTVAVSTGGATPALARAIREELETYFTADYGRLVEVLAETRQELRRQSLHASGDAWNQALKGDFRRLIEEGKPAEAKKLLLATLGAESCE